MPIAEQSELYAAGAELHMLNACVDNTKPPPAVIVTAACFKDTALDTSVLDKPLSSISLPVVKLNWHKLLSTALAGPITAPSILFCATVQSASALPEPVLATTAISKSPISTVCPLNITASAAPATHTKSPLASTDNICPDEPTASHLGTLLASAEAVSRPPLVILTIFSANS